MGALDYQAAEKLIQQLYNAILERAPDLEGLKFHTQRLQALGIAAYPQITHDFLNSDEYKLLLGKKIEAIKTQQMPFLFQIPQGQHKKLIHHVVSLGDHCLTSALLKKYGLKQYSLPFDWIFSNLETVLDCIEDDFAKFLDEKYLVTGLNPGNHLATQHLYYEQKFNVDKFMFNHMAVTVPENRQYILRTVDRFRKLLKSSEPKLFLHIAKPDKQINEKFERCISLLEKMTSNFHLIIIQLTPPSHSFSEFSMNLVQQMDGHKFYKYLPVSQENGTDFEDQFDDMILMKLLSEFDLQLKNIG